MGVVDAVTVEGLRVVYGSVDAVKNVSFGVAAGEVLGVLGGNGAGKSSTLKAVAGLNPPVSGVIRVAGLEVTDPGEVEAARAVLGYCPDVGGLIRQATVREHVQLALLSRGRLDRLSEAERVVKDFGLWDVVDYPTVGFSHGMSRRLSCVLAVLGAERLLILDEPFDGVDPLGVDVTMRYVREACDAGVGVIVSTHLMGLLAEVSDRVMVMVDGVVVDSRDASVFAAADGASIYRGLLTRGGADTE